MRTSSFLLLLAVVLCGLMPAGAGVINIPDVMIGSDSFRAFQDDTTNLEWLDLDNFFSGYTYYGIVALLAGSGYHLATLSELQALQASIPAVPANFAAEAPIVGANYPGSPYAAGERSLMWGIYEDGNPSDGISYSWKFDNDTSWKVVSNVMMEGNLNNGDLGAWVVADAAGAEIPEPSTVALMGIGSACLVLVRRSARRA